MWLTVSVDESDLTVETSGRSFFSEVIPIHLFKDCISEEHQLRLWLRDRRNIQECSGTLITWKGKQPS